MDERSQSSEILRAQGRRGSASVGDAASTPPNGRGAQASAPQRSGRPRRRRFIVLGLVLATLVGGGSYYWVATRDLVSTDDAFIDGDAVHIAPKVSGTVITLNMADNRLVHKGDLLLEIDPRDYAVAVESARSALQNAVAQADIASANLALTKATTSATLEQAESGVDYAKAALSQAQAQIAAAEAEAVRAKADAERYRKLVTVDFASRQRAEEAEAATRGADARLRGSREAVKVAQAQLSQARGKLDEANTGPQQVAVKEAALEAAQAQVATARAALEQAELNLSYTRIAAPHDGIITKRTVNVGDQIQKEQNLAALVFGTPWVTANFKETQLTRMRPGQPVDIAIDAYPDKVFKGRVESVQRGTGAHFALLPAENATGNYVKVVQRVPVKILFDEGPEGGQVLALGMSVVPTVRVDVEPSDPAGPARLSAAGAGH